MKVPQKVNLPQKFYEDFTNLARQEMNKGGMKVERNDERQLEFQIEPQTANEFSYLLQSHFLKLVAVYTNIPGMMDVASEDVIYYLPLDVKYSPPPTTNYNIFGEVWTLEGYWDLLTLSATTTFLKEAVKTVAATTIANLKVRPMMPSEFGGYYNGGAVGPNLSAISGTVFRNIGTVPITLNAGVNQNVVYMQTTANQLQNVVFIIHKIRDTTVPQNAIGFIFYKNNKPYPPLDYSSNQPWIYVPWSRNSYRYQTIGLLTPALVAPNQLFQAHVYSIATATEQLFFEGFTAYIGST